MKRITYIKLASASFSLFLITTLAAQTSFRSIGATMPLAFRKVSTATDKYTDGYYLTMFSYGFRKNLSETETSSFSIGPVFSIGAGISNNGGGSQFIYSGDVQLWGDYNKGIGAVAEPGKNNGFYTGLGFGVSYTGVDGGGIDEISNGMHYGPMGRVGFRFGVYNKRKDMYKPLSVSLYYKHGIEKAHWKTFGFHILTDL